MSERDDTHLSPMDLERHLTTHPTTEHDALSRRIKAAMNQGKKTQTVRLDAEHQAIAQHLQKTRDDLSFQQLVEQLMEEEAQRQRKNWGSLATGFVTKNQSLFDKLADL